mgnify:CR=1 FL=1
MAWWLIAKGQPSEFVRDEPALGRQREGGWVDIDLDSVTLSDGERVPIRASKQRPFRTDSVERGFEPGAGREASLKGSDLTASINGSQQLDLTRLRAAGGPTTTIKITSRPANAEVTLDGRLAGSAPYSLRATSGDHVIVVRMAGFQPWQRKVHVDAEPLALDVALYKQDGSEPVQATKPAEASLGDLAQAARARKPQATAPSTVLEQDGPNAATNQGGGQRDPMQPQSPKQ